MPPVTTTAIYNFQPALSYHQACSTTLPALQVPPPPTFFYPPTTYPSLPPQQPGQPPAPPQPAYHTGYHDFLPMPPVNIPPPVTTTTLMSIAPPTMIVPSGPSGILQQQHGVMSPSLTSGFSGSGDCKSTETSSILSAASYSSVGAAIAPVVSDNGYVPRKGYGLDSMGCQDGYFYSHQNFYSGQVASAANAYGHNNGIGSHQSNNSSFGSSNHHSGIKKVGSSGGANAMKKSASHSSGRAASHASHCDVCQMTFPSAAVLENHVKGSRHARKLKSQQAFRQLKESGTYFRSGDEPGSEIRCEVCQVSVNSSQQLQAHLIGNNYH